MLNRIKYYLLGLGAVITGILALVLNKKRDDSKNIEAEVKVRVNEDLIKSEEEKQAEIIKKANEEKNKDVTKEDIIDFFNNRPNN